MINKNTEPSQGEGVAPPPAPADTSSRSQSHGGNQVYKSGPLFLSSKGIGWTSWKKRWFILTRTSLVFFRSDPNAIPQKANEVNLTLGGIDLNSSASVVVKEDKKLLTVLFPDGRDGRAFTLKAETSEDLLEWKAALEKALSEAPGAANVSEQNGIIKDDNKTDPADSFLEQSKDRQPPRSLVIGRPILLALEDIDGNPSFLEKALRFIEEHGVKVEGILRQAADVELVERRIREYEHGKSEFSADEDAHVIADCIKYFLRELPSHPVPASCCNALLEAYLKSLGADRNMKVNAMRTAICETFPEPNRRLLQRILVMMQTVASHKSNNRMSPSAVAACMAPLLLRPLLAGDCELEHGFDIGSDNSLQLMKAAAAANHAQTIVITLLDEYNNIFGEEGSVSPGLYSYSEDSESDFTEDDESFEDDDDYYESEGSDADHDDDSEHPTSQSCSENGGETGENHQKMQSSERSSPGSKSHEADNSFKVDLALSCSAETMLPQQNNMEGIEKHLSLDNRGMTVRVSKSNELHADDIVESSLILGSTGKSSSATSTLVNGPMSSVRPATAWVPTPAKNLSMESTDPLEDEAEIGRLEIAKADLQNKIAEEVKQNASLQQDLEKRKNALHERRLALEQDVARLQEQLQKERELRKMPQGPFPVPASIDEKTKADFEDIAQAEADTINLNQNAIDLGVQLKQELEQNNSLVDSCSQPQQMQNHHERRKERKKNSERAAAVESTSSKDSHVDKTDCESYAKQEPASLPNKFPPQNVLSNPVCNSNTSAESGAVKLGPSNSKKSSTKGEGSNFALSKLTNRLNFLKERRNQIATELQNIVEKGKNAGQSNQNVEKVKGSEPC